MRLLNDPAANRSRRLVRPLICQPQTRPTTAGPARRPRSNAFGALTEARDNSRSHNRAKRWWHPPSTRLSGLRIDRGPDHLRWTLPSNHLSSVLKDNSQGPHATKPRMRYWTTRMSRRCADNSTQRARYVLHSRSVRTPFTPAHRRRSTFSINATRSG